MFGHDSHSNPGEKVLLTDVQVLSFMRGRFTTRWRESKLSSWVFFVSILSCLVVVLFSCSAILLRAAVRAACCGLLCWPMALFHACCLQAAVAGFWKISGIFKGSATHGRVRWSRLAAPPFFAVASPASAVERVQRSAESNRTTCYSYIHTRIRKNSVSEQP